IGVVVIAVGKPGSVVEEEIEAALVFEVGAIAFEIVGAELVDYEDDDELGMAVIGGGARGGNTEKRERANEDEGGESFELRHSHSMAGLAVQAHALRANPLPELVVAPGVR